jgi:hypothetical protein
MSTDDNTNPEPRHAEVITEEREPAGLRLGWSRDGKTYDARSGLAWAGAPACTCSTDDSSDEGFTFGDSTEAPSTCAMHGLGDATRTP